MNKKVLSIVLTAALIITLVMPTMAEKWGPDEFNLNLAFYSCEANGELKQRQPVHIPLEIIFTSDMIYGLTE